MKTQRSIGKWNRTEIKMYLFVSNSLLQFKAWVKISWSCVGRTVWVNGCVTDCGVQALNKYRGNSNYVHE